MGFQEHNRSPQPRIYRGRSWTTTCFFIGVVLLFGFIQLRDKVPAYPFRKNAQHSDSLVGTSGCTSRQGFDSFDDLKATLLSVPDPQKVREWSLHYTSDLHYLGQGEPFAIWTRQKWQEFGVKNISIDYFPIRVPLPTPRYQRIALLKLDAEGEVTEELFAARLKENSTYINPVSKKSVNAPQYMAYAPSGNVTAQYVYANFGGPSDYEDMRSANVTVDGKIVIIKQPGVVIREGMDGPRVMWEAQHHGAVGVIWYLDPQDDGLITESHGYIPYPNGPARARDSILRKDAIHINHLDPNSPQDVYLPVIPISYTEAVPLLKTLNGLGPQPNDLSSNWAGGELGYLGVKYNTGPSPEEMVINLVNDMESHNVSAIDVIGTFKGVIEDEVVILGNHRDAWSAGAGDPNSGSSALNEVVRAFSTAVQKGWKPRRTLVFASWDGHEPGIWGSQSWIHANLPWLQNTTVAYLEVEIAGIGSEFFTKASPILTELMRDATAQVLSPNRTEASQTVHPNNWDGEVEPAAGGDVTYFVMNGFSTINFGFRATATDPHFHWHSDYDTVEWMDKVGDPDWSHHIASAQIWAIAAARIVEQPIHPFSVGAFASALAQFSDDVKVTPTEESSCVLRLDLLKDAISRLQKVAHQFDAEAGALTKLLEHDEAAHEEQSDTIKAINFKYRNFERHFIVDYQGRPTSILFPPCSYRLKLPAFPQLTHSVNVQDWCDAEKWRKVITEKVESAAAFLIS